MLKLLKSGWRWRRFRGLAGLPIGEAFDRIYEKDLWSNGGGEPSGSGSYGRLAEEYVEFVGRFIREREIRSIVDIGCGDFNVGSWIAPMVERYQGFDVSARIIEINRRRFAHMTQVEFRHLDACREPLPNADLVTIRQVLQHLTNAEIESILRNVERSAPRFTLVTEHLGRPGPSFRPNRDLPGHSAQTRVAIGSGVVLDAPPFSRHAVRVHSIPMDNDEALAVYSLASPT